MAITSVEHSDLTGDELHELGKRQSGDPGAIGAGKVWHDSDDDKVWVRNQANSGWVELTGAGAAHPNLATHDALGLATDAELATHAATSGHTHPNLATHDALGLATDAELATHAAAADPHPTYSTAAELAAGITAHEALANPHATYHTAAEVAADIATHAGLTDPHTGYRLESAQIQTADIQGDAVTYAKMQNVSATDRILGRDTAGAGDVEEMTATQVLGMASPANVQAFVAGGTWTKPAGARTVVVEVIGCGGGGGGVTTNPGAGYNVSGGGGGGGYSRKLFAASALSATEAIAIGTPGAGGTTTPTAGSTGGTCSFGTSGTLVQATGGTGGNSDSTNGTGGRDTSGGNGGVGSGGDINLTGSEGGYGFGSANNAGSHAGTGGAAPMLSGTVYGAAATANTSARNGFSYGGGGAGAANNNSNTTARVGGNGAVGIVIVTTYT